MATVDGLISFSPSVGFVMGENYGFQCINKVPNGEVTFTVSSASVPFNEFPSYAFLSAIAMNPGTPTYTLSTNGSPSNSNVPTPAFTCVDDFTIGNLQLQPHSYTQSDPLESIALVENSDYFLYGCNREYNFPSEDLTFTSVAPHTFVTFFDDPRADIYTTDPLDVGLQSISLTLELDLSNTVT
mmetsp:Transcript_16591/g.15875  ORF Transcript_16591/g.15875 Transcript_16591/m.15875 type:complete len:184 (+) Transcript_16591:239-790(+)